MKWWDQMPWFSFSEFWVLSQLFQSPLSLSSRGFLVPLYLRANLALLTRLYPSIGSTWFSVYSVYALAYFHFGCWEYNIRSCCDSYLPVFFPAFVSDQFSYAVMSDSLWPRVLQHYQTSITNFQSLLKLMSIKLVVSSNCLILCPPLLLLPSIFPSIRVFPMSQFFASGGQSIGISASASVLPMNIQVWFPLGFTGWISLQFKGVSRVFPNTTVQFFGTQLSLWSNCPIHTLLLGKA